MPAVTRVPARRAHSPCSSVNCSASTTRSISSTFASQRQIVHDLMLDDAVAVDQEGGAQRHSIRMLDAVGPRDVVLMSATIGN